MINRITWINGVCMVILYIYIIYWGFLGLSFELTSDCIMPMVNSIFYCATCHTIQSKQLTTILYAPIKLYQLYKEVYGVLYHACHTSLTDKSFGLVDICPVIKPIFFSLTIWELRTFYHSNSIQLICTCHIGNFDFYTQFCFIVFVVKVTRRLPMEKYIFEKI